MTKTRGTTIKSFSELLKASAHFFYLASRRYDDKCKNDPVWLAYNRAYNARYMKKKMTTAKVEQWSRWAVELRDKAERGEMGFEVYQRENRV